MANQQLVDYIKSQLTAGVGKEAVRGQLAQAGWSKDDIEDSMKAMEPVSATPPVSVVQVRENSADKASKITSGTISVSDLLPNSQLDMAPASSAKASSAQEEKKAQSADVASTAAPHLPKFHISIAIIVLTIMSLAFAGGAVYLYMQAKDLQDKSVVLGTTNDAMSTKIASLNTQVADLTKAVDDSGAQMKAQLETLTGERDELAKTLSFFFAPTGGSSEAVSVTAKGALSGGGKVLYALTLENGIRLSVVNSKDVKVDAAFKALASTSSVEIAGTHVPGFRDVTVTAVNGASVQ